MARRYVRDNRGRFASVGATARGGRLRTASGGKRATQTKAVAGGAPKGTIGKPKGLQPGSIKPKAANAAKVVASTSARQARAAANVSRANTAKPLPGNRRLTKAQVRSQVRTESAQKIYQGGEVAQREVRNARGLARTERARNNWMQTRDQRLANAKAASLPLVRVGKPKGLKPGSIKPKSAKPAIAQVSSARQAATQRLKVKTQTRRAIRADRSSVVTPGQRSRLEGGKGAVMKAARPMSTVARPRTSGNTRQQVASRVQRKLGATQASLSSMTRRGNVLHQGTYERQLKRKMTLQRAQSYLTTGKLPGRDNSIAAQRSMKQARAKLAAKNASRRRGALGKISEAKAGRIVSRVDAHRPGQRRATASSKRDMNSLRTHQRATAFLLGPGSRARKRGQNLTVNQSVQRAVANAAKKKRR